MNGGDDFKESSNHNLHFDDILPGYSKREEMNENEVVLTNDNLLTFPKDDLAGQNPLNHKSS